MSGPVGMSLPWYIHAPVRLSNGVFEAFNKTHEEWLKLGKDECHLRSSMLGPKRNKIRVKSVSQEETT